MIAEAERYKEDDRRVQEKSAAKGKLEGYASSLKHAVEDSGTKEKFSSSDRETILEAVKVTERWIETEGDRAEKEAFESKYQELTSKCSEIMQRFYSGGGGGGAAPGGPEFGGEGPPPGAEEKAGPKVEEVD